VNEFHTYLTELRQRHFSSLSKLAKILGIEYQVWRKVERGINPPPKRFILEKFCNLVHARHYEKNQLYALARRWKPHPDTGSLNHGLYHKGLGSDWAEAIMRENTPDYEHKYWGKRY
jgi:hypothetical protein